MPPSRAECVGNGNKGISISFVIVPMAITLRCHSYGSKHMMDGRIESGMKKWVFYSTSTELFLALVGKQMQVFSCLFGFFSADGIIPNTDDECAAFNLTPIIALNPVITATPVINHFLQRLF